MNRQNNYRGKKILNRCAFCGKLHVLFGEDMERAIGTGHIATMCKRCLSEKRRFGPLKFDQHILELIRQQHNEEISTFQENITSEIVPLNELKTYLEKFETDLENFELDLILSDQSLKIKDNHQENIEIHEHSTNFDLTASFLRIEEANIQLSTILGSYDIESLEKDHRDFLQIFNDNLERNEKIFKKAKQRITELKDQIKETKKRIQMNNATYLNLQIKQKNSINLNNKLHKPFDELLKEVGANVGKSMAELEDEIYYKLEATYQFYLMDHNSGSKHVKDLIDLYNNFDNESDRLLTLIEEASQANDQMVVKHLKEHHFCQNDHTPYLSCCNSDTSYSYEQKLLYKFLNNTNKKAEKSKLQTKTIFKKYKRKNIFSKYRQQMTGPRGEYLRMDLKKIRIHVFKWMECGIIRVNHLSYFETK